MAESQMTAPMAVLCSNDCAEANLKRCVLRLWLCARTAPAAGTVKAARARTSKQSRNTDGKSLVVQPRTRINKNANKFGCEHVQENLGGINACSPATLAHQTEPLLKVKQAIAIPVEGCKYFRGGSAAFFW